VSLRALVLALSVAAVAGSAVVTAPAAGAATTATRCWLSCPVATPAPSAVPSPTSAPDPGEAATPLPSSSPAVKAITIPRPADEVGEALALINAARRARGVRPLVPDAALSEIARAHTATMIARNLLHHNDSLFTREAHQRLGIKIFGENVGVGSGVADNHDGFMNSRYHRENIENASFVLVGLAVGRSADGRVWVTQDFGTVRIGGTVGTAPRPVAISPSAPRPVVAPAPSRTSTGRAPRPVAPARMVRAAVPVARLAAPPVALAALDAPPVVAAFTATATDQDTVALTYRTASSSAAPIGAGVLAALAGTAFLVVVPRARRVSVS